MPAPVPMPMLGSATEMGMGLEELTSMLGWPGQDALLDRAFESAPSQQSKRPQAGAPEERAAQRQRFER